MNTVLWMDSLSVGQKNVVRKERIEPSGGSLTVSRVLNALGHGTSVMGVVGEENSTSFFQLLKQYGIRHTLFPCKGAVKQNITMMLPKNTVLRIERDGFTAGFAQLAALQQELLAQVTAQENSTLIFADRQMQGLSGKERIRFIQNCCGTAARPVVAQSGLTLSELKLLRPQLAMIGVSELKASAQVNFRNENTMLRCMQSMTGEIDHIVVDLGVRGFLYADQQACYRILFLQNKVAHPESADYFLGGLLAGIQGKLPIHEALSMAGGAAAWLTLCESESFDPSSVERGKQRLLVEKMK